MYNELLNQDEICDMVDALASLIQDKKDFCSKDQETAREIARLECLLTKIKTQQSEFNLLAREPHEVTFAVFSQHAKVTLLSNHGRRWQVTYGPTYSAFSDVGDIRGALKDVHAGAVNNALYMNERDAPDIYPKPTMPPAEVLKEYPEIVALFSAPATPSTMTPEQLAVVETLRLKLEEAKVAMRGLLGFGVEWERANRQLGRISEVEDAKVKLGRAQSFIASVDALLIPPLTFKIRWESC